MPFSVQPSKSVVISGSAITKDDFLKLILEDGEVLYVRTKQEMDEPYFANYTFDPEFLPTSLASNIKGVVDEWYRRHYAPWEHVRRRVHERRGDLFKNKGGLRGQLFNQLVESIYVYHSRDSQYRIDVDHQVRVTAWCLAEDAVVFDAHNSDDYSNNAWVYPSPIAAILATTRAAIREELAMSSKG